MTEFVLNMTWFILKLCILGQAKKIIRWRSERYHRRIPGLLGKKVPFKHPKHHWSSSPLCQAMVLSLSTNWFVLNMTEYVFNTTGSVRYKTGFVWYPTGFVLKVIGFYLNMTGIVINMTAIVQNLTGFVLNTWYLS